jgi:uncharacterized protein with PIN domain
MIQINNKGGLQMAKMAKIQKEKLPEILLKIQERLKKKETATIKKDGRCSYCNQKIISEKAWFCGGCGRTLLSRREFNKLKLPYLLKNMLD